MSELIAFTQKLLRCKSVTPADNGAMALLNAHLENLGFYCHIQTFSDEIDSIPNLYASYGNGERNLCFAGHTDVVPAGDEAAWSSPPFAAKIVDEHLIARGVTDMKAAICAFMFAAERFIVKNPNFDGKISFLITGDEEARAVNGTQKMLQWLADNNIKINHCLVGEPTNPEKIGEMLKIGRRGSLNFELTINGIQGHVAYPDKAENPVTKLVEILHKLKNKPLDNGNEEFQASNLEITDIEVGNPTTNVIPVKANARFNVRYNNLQSHEGLINWVEAICNEVAKDTYNLHYEAKNEAFICDDLELANHLVSAVDEVLGVTPVKSTSGGTSDARFIKDYCPVIEFGLISATAHKIDEKVLVNDIEKLSEIYYHFIVNYFKS